MIFLVGGCGPACPTPWYADLDGDSYGNREDFIRSCEEPKGYVRDARDCDDRDANIHPGAPEACDEIDNDCDGTVDPDPEIYFADVDGDGIGAADRFIEACGAPQGFVPLAGDCDDADERAFPGGIEVCDGVDNDCDNLIDEGISGDTYFYPDLDQDGWGDQSGGELLCTAPEGWVDRPGDCSDLDDMRFPGAVERCNGVDDDCDGAIDLLDPGGVVGVLVAYRDADFDGYGAGAGLLVCSYAFDLSPFHNDCDDTNPEISPDAREVCGGTDEDCDGDWDDQDSSVDPDSQIQVWVDDDRDGLGDPGSPVRVCALTDAVVTNALDCDDDDAAIGLDQWRLDADGDGSGGILVEAGTGCSPPGPGYINVAAPFDCDDEDPLVRPGAPDACGDGIDQDCSQFDPRCGSDDALASLSAMARTLVEGLPGASQLVASRSMDMDLDGHLDVWVGTPGASTLSLLKGPVPEVGVWLPSESVQGLAGEELGFVVEPIEDVSGDGLPDVVVGVPGAGEVQVRSSPDWDPWFSVLVPGAGRSVALVDRDGLGPRELVVGEPTLDRVGLFSLENAGIVDMEDADILFIGADSLGSTLACCTDVEGDGVAELVVGAPQYAGPAGLGSGRIYLAPTDLSGLWPIHSSHRGYYDGESGQGLGASIATGQDVDGDGLDDVLAVQPLDGAGAGAAYLFGPTLAGSVDDAAVMVVEGYSGLALGTAGTLADVDGDGFGDLLLSTPNADVGGQNGGAVYVFLGPQSGVHSALDADRLWYGGEGARYGSSLFASPLDVDQGDDVWVGTQEGAGALWLIPGR